MRMPRQGGDHAGRAVEQCEQLLTAGSVLQRLMGDDDHPALARGGELLLEPGGLAGLDKAAGAAAAAHEVEHDQPQRIADVLYVIQLLGSGPWSAQPRLGRSVRARP